MSRMMNRYASALRSSNMRSEPDTVFSDADVIGAMGKASQSEPLAVALSRLFCGDNHAANEIVTILATMARCEAMPRKVDINAVQATDMARAALAWYRDGWCKACGSHGYRLIRGAPAIGDEACEVCHGLRKVPFETQFHKSQRDLALWLVSEIEREQCRAGPVAMSKLRDRMM